MFRDPLTDALNRIGFEAALDAAPARQVAGGGALALAIVDLDGFKAVNDSAGHAAGDMLLQHAARRIAKQVDARDAVARLGGDAFAVIIEGRSRSENFVLEVTEGAIADPVSARKALDALRGAGVRAAPRSTISAWGSPRSPGCGICPSTS
jgi:diguanylate cyclase (GGDEF)-like protein